jgi:hypothetical protein
LLGAEALEHVETRDLRELEVEQDERRERPGLIFEVRKRFLSVTGDVAAASATALSAAASAADRV